MTGSAVLSHSIRNERKMSSSSELQHNEEGKETVSCHTHYIDLIFV